MSCSGVVRGMLGVTTAVVMVVILMFGGDVYAQDATELNREPSIEPNDDAPNPYRTIDGWAKLPDGRVWGSSPGVDIDPDGEHIWVLERCGANSCAGRSDLDPILKFDAAGNLVTSFGGGMIVWPHGLHVDQDGNVWVTDARANPERTMGQVVVKFSPEGEVLLTLGTPGVTGEGPDAFDQPCDVVTASNGDIFVADGHSGQLPNAPPDSASRIVKYSRDGTFIKEWGKLGSAPGEFLTPHALAFDPEGRLIVADRGNGRLQMFDQDGNFMQEWRQFGRPAGLHFDTDGNIYVADSGSDTEVEVTFSTGVRIGSLESGEVVAFIDGSTPEGVAVDAAGNVYGALVTYGGALLRYVKD